MADISAIKPSGTSGASYNIKDATARTNINTLNNNVSALSGSVNSLNTRVTTLENAGGGAAFWFADGVGSDPYEDWGLSDCDFTIPYEESTWGYDDDDQPILKTSYPTYTYYNRLEDTIVRVGTLKVGDIIIAQDVISSDFLGRLPNDETIGYINNSTLFSELDGRYQKQSPPAPDPLDNTFSVHGSDSYIKLGQYYDRLNYFYYVTGLATFTRPSEDFSGKTNTFKIAKCFRMMM